MAAKKPTTKKPAAKKPAVKKGRPKWKPSEQQIRQAEQLAAQGLTVKQVAASLGVGATAFFDRQNDYPELKAAMQGGRSKGIATITNALFNKAKKGDNIAMIFYLKNRDPDNWLEKREVQIDPITVKVVRACRK